MKQMKTRDFEQLVGRAKDGEHLALETLLGAHARELEAHIATRIPAKFAAALGVDDVAQEAYLQAFLKIDTLRQTSRSAFKAWLKSVADLTLLHLLRGIDRQKRGGRFRRIHDVPDSTTGSLVRLIETLPGPGETASRQLAKREAIAALQIGIAGLPEQQRLAIQLHLLQEASLDETAKALSCTKGAVRALIQRGKKKLTEVMGRASAWMDAF